MELPRVSVLRPAEQDVEGWRDVNGFEVEVAGVSHPAVWTIGCVMRRA